MTSSEFRSEIQIEFTDFRIIRQYNSVQFMKSLEIIWNLFVISWIFSREFRSEISVEFTNLRITGDSKRIQMTSGDFDRIPVTLSDIQKEIWVESTKFDNSIDFRRIQITLSDLKWIQIRNSNRIHWLQDNSTVLEVYLKI